MNAAIYAAVATLGYLLGSIPFGLILVKLLRGEDVRLSGSGNIGATNVARSGGAKLGVATLVLDALKGTLAVLIALEAGRQFGDIDRGLLAAVTALAAILGHVFPVWLGFRGGKGVATAVGAFAALAPRAVLVVLAVFLIVVAISRYISLGSIAAAVFFPVCAALLSRGQTPNAVLLIMSAASLLVVVKHRANIRRLLSGTESRFQLHKG
jgi:glycerol-3-phosphate acyltransferase PlsY